MMVFHLGSCRIFNKFCNISCKYNRHNLQRSSIRLYIALPRLSPQQVTDILQANELSKEFSENSSVKSFETNQLASNNPIEDTRSEAKCIFNGGFLFGIFDGHGGGACAQVVSKRLFHYISACLLPQERLKHYLNSLRDDNKLELIESFENQVEFAAGIKEIYRSSLIKFVRELTELNNEDRIKVENAMQRAFLRLDSDLSDEAFLNLSRKDAARTLAVAMSGAVAIVAHIYGPHLHVAGCGDCQAVLGTLSDDDTWSAKLMNVEHNYDNLSEVERILSEHPECERTTVIKMERLLGQLAPLRSLGDFRYKWNRDTLKKNVVPFLGESAIPPNYYTPPYLTAKPEIRYHRLNASDKFLILGSDGLWDLMTPIQAVKLVGEHMRQKISLIPVKLPQENMKLSQINKLLLQRKEGLKKKPIDKNAATHLLRHALGGTESGIDHMRLCQYLTLPSEVVRVFRDDITITIIYLDSNYLQENIDPNK